MRVAFFIGLFGLLSVGIIGSQVLALSFGEILFIWTVSLITGLFSLLTTLAAERNTWVKNHILRGSVLTWAFLVILYFGILLALAPQIRDVENLIWLFLPLMVAHGWTLLIFGPIQDQIVRRSQQKSHLTF